MRVGIIGAGITGLTTSFALERAGVDQVVFEADEVPGGLIRTRRVDGRVLDCGPQRCRLTPALEALVTELGLDDQTVAPTEEQPLFVYADGRLRRVPRSPTSFLRTDLLSWRGKLRMLAEPATPQGRPEEVARDLFERKFGSEATRNLLEPLVGGIFGSDPAEMPVGRALPRILRLEDRHGSLLLGAINRRRKDDRPPVVSFANGMATLPRALYRRVADRVRLGTPVTSVRRARGRYEVVTEDDRTAVDAVVATTPAGAAATLLRTLSPEAARRLGRLSYKPLTVVHLRADLDRAGMGYQVRRDEGLQTRGVTWNASLFDRDGVYTCFLADGATWPDQTDRELGRIARDEFEAITGSAGSVLAVTRVRPGMPAYDRSWAALDGVDLPEGVHLAGSYTGGPGIPSRVGDAIELAERLAAESDGATDEPIRTAI